MAPEFVWNGQLAGLKDHRTPFFEAQRFRGIPPRYAMTLDDQDVQDIESKYPDCLLIFFVNWEVVRYQKMGSMTGETRQVVREIEIEPLHGIGTLTPERMFELVEGKRMHQYQRWVNDRRGNARTSYGIGVRQMDLVWIDPESLQDERS